MNKYQEILAEIKNAKHIVITSHKSPDGDSIGSSLGLYHFIKKKASYGRPFFIINLLISIR